MTYIEIICIIDDAIDDATPITASCFDADLNTSVLVHLHAQNWPDASSRIAAIEGRDLDMCSVSSGHIDLDDLLADADV